VRKSARFRNLDHGSLMDGEHINAIDNALLDLTRRTESLRGYL
jgi:hypothetical protein